MQDSSNQEVRIDVDTGEVKLAFTHLIDSLSLGVSGCHAWVLVDGQKRYINNDQLAAALGRFDKEMAIRFTAWIKATDELKGHIESRREVVR